MPRCACCAGYWVARGRRPSGVTLAGKTAFEVFAWAGADDSLERLTEGSVGLVSDRAGNVDKLFVTRFE